MRQLLEYEDIKCNESTASRRNYFEFQAILRLIGCLLLIMGLSSYAVAEETQQVPEKKEQQAVAAIAELSADEIAQRVQHFYQRSQDFQASFSQTYTDVAAGEAKTSSGRVYFKKPGKMRWDYTSAKDSTQRDKVLVSDGNTFWIYEFEFQQVFKQCLKDSQLPTSLRFLMGEGELLEEFNVARGDRSSEKQIELRLTPKEPTAQYRELRFLLDPQTFQVIETTVYDPYGNSNRIRFSNTLVNRNLPDSGFEFKPPPGARLLNPHEKCD